MLTRKIGYMVVGGLLALGIAFGGAAVLAQTDEADPAPAEETPVETDETSPFIPRLGRDALRAERGDHDEALAAALGITVEELQAAKDEARVAAIEQAVADGLITQEQADQLLAADAGGHFRFGGLRFGISSDHDELLAEALGISVEELAAAREQVMADQLAAMVASGAITQEEADMILAHKAVQDYMDYDALNAAAQEAYAAAVAQALADGVITQAQADQLLSEAANFGGFGPGFGGPHGRGGRGHGGRGPGGASGFSPFQNGQIDTTSAGVDA